MPKGKLIVTVASVIVIGLMVLSFILFKINEASIIISSFSTLAIATFTIFYAISTRDQVKLMEIQNRDYRKSQLIERQPVVIGKISNFHIEIPRFFYTPPDDKYSVSTRYFCSVEINNVGSGPALNIDLTANILVPEEGEGFYNMRSSEFVDYLSENIENDEAKIKERNFMFVGDDECKLINVLRRNNMIGPKGWPVLILELRYRNAVGGCFLSRTASYLHRSKDDDKEVLRSWESEILSQDVNYEEDILNLRKLENTENWDQVFAAVKEKLHNNIISEDVIIGCPSIPGLFEFRIISEKEYVDHINLSSYGVPLPVELNNCIVKMESE